ncbi:MAG TPA: hypothetical protein VEJ67_00105 [Candidatus Cybelea sp.]|nr:hypothetical protein [Candidatus Cybelea sp.]
MARKCPHCFAVFPAKKVLAYLNDLDCASCGTPLEISALSRNLSCFVGLVCAAVTWRASAAYYGAHPGALGWALPVLFSYLTYSVAAALTLILTGDLRLRPTQPVPDAALPRGAH